MNWTTKRAIAALPATLLLAMSLPASPALAVTPWNQGFERDTDGWLELPGQEAVAGIKRVGSGYAGIESASGGNHAVVTGPHMFTRFGGYAAEWDGTWSSALDVYLDPDWQAGAGFDYSVAANGSNGAHKRDFIIHVAKDADTGTLLVGASNNTDNKPRTDLETRHHGVVAEAGWYTVRHTFRDDAGVLAVDIDLVDSDGHVVFTQTLSDPTDTIAALGGNRYGWFTALSGTQLAIDDSRLTRPEQEPGRSYSTDFSHVAITKAEKSRWRMAGAYDAAIVTQDGDAQLRISNAKTSGSFGDMLFSPTLAVSATEAATDNRFDASFVIAPADYQEGLVVTVSPDNGEGGRNGFLRIKHVNGGMTLEMAGSYLDDAGQLKWEYKDVATGLDVSKPHTVTLEVVKRPGAEGEINDVFRASVDGGKAMETGTFEAYYFANKDQTTGKPEANHPTNTLLFRVSGTAAGDTLGKGILIDDLSMSVSTEKPVDPPVDPPVDAPVDPPVTPPVDPPVTPPVTPGTPPVTPPVTPGTPGTPPVTPPGQAKKATVKAKPVSNGSKLYLNVNPNKGSGYWNVKIQKKTSNGWKTLKGTYRTQGTSETRTINLSKGSYRAVVQPKYGHTKGYSSPVTLTR